MDKYEYSLRHEQLIKYYNAKDFKNAAAVADTIDWRRVSNWKTLAKVIDIYYSREEFKKARNIAVIAYNKNMGGRILIFKLTDILIELDELDDAWNMYQQYKSMAPNDTNGYLLLYKWNIRHGATPEQLIDIVEEYLKKEPYNEASMYELACLYEAVGDIQKALELCDKLILYFNQGDYFESALMIKSKYNALTQKQKGMLEGIDAKRNPYAEATVKKNASSKVVTISIEPKQTNAADIYRKVTTELNRQELIDSAGVEAQPEIKPEKIVMDPVPVNIPEQRIEQRLETRSEQKHGKKGGIMNFFRGIIGGDAEDDDEEDDDDDDMTIAKPRQREITDLQPEYQPQYQPQMQYQPEMQYQPQYQPQMQYQQPFDYQQANQGQIIDMVPEDSRIIEQNFGAGNDKAVLPPAMETQVTKDSIKIDLKPLNKFDTNFLQKSLQESLKSLDSETHPLGEFEKHRTMELSKEEVTEVKEKTAEIEATEPKQEVKQESKPVAETADSETKVIDRVVLPPTIESTMDKDELDFAKTKVLKPKKHKKNKQEEVLQADTKPLSAVESVMPVRAAEETKEVLENPVTSEKSEANETSKENLSETMIMFQKSVEADEKLPKSESPIMDYSYKYNMQRSEFMISPNMNTSRIIQPGVNFKVDNVTYPTEAPAPSDKEQPVSELTGTLKPLVDDDFDYDEAIKKELEAREDELNNKFKTREVPVSEIEDAIRETEIKIDIPHLQQLKAAADVDNAIREEKKEVTNKKKKKDLKDTQDINREIMQGLIALGVVEPGTDLSETKQLVSISDDFVETVEALDEKRAQKKNDEISQQIMNSISGIVEDTENVAVADTTVDTSVEAPVENASSEIPEVQTEIPVLQEMPATEQHHKKKKKKKKNHQNNQNNQNNAEAVATAEAEADETSEPVEASAPSESAEAQEPAENKASIMMPSANVNPNKKPKTSIDGYKSICSVFFPRYEDQPQMQEKICKALMKLDKRKKDGSSKSGNVIISGNKNSNKEDFAISFVQAVNNMDGRKRRLCRIDAVSANEKGFAKVIEKVGGNVLLINNAASLNSSRIKELKSVLSQQTGNMIAIMVDNESAMVKFLGNNPSLNNFFDVNLEIKNYTPNELVEIAREYVRERNFEIGENAVYKLYLVVDKLGNDESISDVEALKRFMDAVMENARERSSHGIANIFRKKDSAIVIKEIDIEEV